MNLLLENAPLLLVAAFFAGALNAVAGGGTFLTLPALIFAGLPPVAANATGTVALLPGYLSSTYAFRRDLRMPEGLSANAIVVISLAGGAAGGALLVTTPGGAFKALIPWLLLLATAAFAAGPRILAAARRRTHASDDDTPTAASPVVAGASILAVTIYGGYFNGGVGIIMLALFSLLGMTNLNAANALKNLVSVLLTVIAVVVYAWGGAVSWPEAGLMAVTATLGGYVGARLIRRVPASIVRTAVILIGLVMTVLFFIY